MIIVERVVAASLRAVAGRQMADPIIGDLLEEHTARRARGRVRARLWLLAAATGILGRFWIARVRESAFAILDVPRAIGRATWDIGPTVRSLAHSRWFSITAIGVIALGMLLTTTVFAVVSSVLLTPLPYPNAGELYLVTAGYSDAVLNRPGVQIRNRSGLPLTWQAAEHMRRIDPAILIAPFSATSGSPAFGSIGTAPLVEARVGEGFFDVVGVPLLLGGLSGDDYSGASGARPAVITYALWQQQFGGALDVIGAPLASGTEASARYRVAGVLPASFVYPTNGPQPDVLVPLAPSDAQRADPRVPLGAFLARLSPHASLAADRAAFDASAATLARELGNGGENGGAGPPDHIAVESLASWIDRAPKSTATEVLSVSLCLLLLACVTVAGLVATRGVDRSHERALRRALGCTTADLMVAAFLESALLVAVGTGIGLALATPLIRLVGSILPSERGFVPQLDVRVLLFATLAAAITTVLVALGPIWRSRGRTTIQTLDDTVRAGARVRRPGRFLIIAGQVALACILTTSGALVVGSLLRASIADQGFDAEQVVIMRGNLPAADVRDPASVRGPRALVIDEVLRAVRALPGIVAAGATDAPILAQGSPGGMFRGDTYTMTEGFSDALQLRLLSGRWPTAAEISAGAPVVLLSPDAVRDYFPDRPAVGGLLRTGDGGATAQSFQVIGIVAPARLPSWDWNGSRYTQFFTPYRAAAFRREATFVVRTSRPEQVVAWAAAQATTHPGVQFTFAATARDLIDGRVRPRRLEASVFASFAIAALVIAGVGVFGVVSMTLARRRREIGVRLTLGATSAQISRLLVREQAPAVVAGLVFGLGGSALAGALVRAYVYGTPTTYAPLWIAIIALVLGVTSLAIGIPAVEASRVDPAMVLRSE